MQVSQTASSNVIKLTQKSDRSPTELQEALRQVEIVKAEIKAIFQAFADIYFRLDAEGNILDCQMAKSEDAFNLPEVFTGKPIGEVLPTNVAQQCHTAIDRAIATQSVVIVKYSLALQDGPRDFEARFVPFVENQAIAIVRDISDRLAALRERQRADTEKALLAIAVEYAAQAIEITDAQARIQYINPACELMTGYSSAEVIGKTPAIFRSGQHSQEFYQAMWNTVSQGQVWQGSLIGKRKDGSLFPQEATISPVRNPAGEIVNYVAFKQDITERTQTQQELKQSLSLLQATFEATADGILVTDTQGKVLNYNQKFLDLWQIPHSALSLQEDRQLLSSVLEKIKNPEQFLARIEELYLNCHLVSCDTIELTDGRFFERHSQPQSIGENLVGRVWCFRDITERQRSAEQIRYQALHDPLTGLPNRMLFDRCLAEALDRAKANDETLAVCFLDLDRFKTINDTFGHAAGDRLLQCVAQQIKNCLRAGDTVARWAGDEFTLILPQVKSQANVIAVVERILAAFQPCFDLGDRQVAVSCSIGIALYPHHGQTAETLLKNADAALYTVKARGKNNYQFYASPSHAQATQQLILKQDLDAAIERGELALYYQPIIQTSHQKIQQIEASIHWQHPKFGLIPPEKFLPLAEDNDLILAIEEWGLQTACNQYQAWQSLGLADFGLTMKLVSRQFQQPHLAQKVKQILQQSKLTPQCLELQVSDHLTPDNLSYYQTVFNDLNQLGIKTGLANFGINACAFVHLKQLPIQTLKLAPSLIESWHRCAQDLAIISAILALGKGLNLQVVAAGVETAAQQQALQSLECNLMQGNHLSSPLPLESMIQYLESAKSS